MADKRMTRRDFLKGVGAAGAVASVAAVFAEARAEALSPDAYTGWESRQGKEYIDRRPFEVDTPQSYEIVGELKRRDQRTYDTRVRIGAPVKEEDALVKYEAGDPVWVDFYTKNPTDGDGVPTLEKDRRYRDEWRPAWQQRIDDTIERRTQFTLEGEGFLAGVRGDAYQNFPFPSVDKLPEEWDWEHVRERRAIFHSPEAASEFVKRVGADFSGTLIRITKTNPAWFYANGLRGAENDVPIGEEFPIRPWWEYAIVVTRPMGFDTLAADPNYGSSYDGYTPSSMVAWMVAEAVKQLGYPARVGSPRQGYEQFAVPFAVDAGFGELARTCNCVSPDMGGNFRQSMVFTSLPMAIDKPINAGVADFCKKCKICAEYCSTGAISMADDVNWEMAGVKRWDVDGSMCYTTWEQVSGGAPIIYKGGSPGRGLAGCRACISVCPWFRKNNWLHNTVRQVMAKDPTTVTHDIALQFERNLYPRSSGEAQLPPEMKGVREPPSWLKTDAYVKGFVDTPLGEK